MIRALNDHIRFLRTAIDRRAWRRCAEDGNGLNSTERLEFGNYYSTAIKVRKVTRGRAYSGAYINSCRRWARQLLLLSDLHLIKKPYQRMTYRTFTLLGRARKDASSCLVCWPEEDNNLSIVDVKKIISPSPKDIEPDTFCKVQGFEKHLCKILAVGSEAEMKAKMEEMEQMAEDDPAARPPPRKKALLVKKTTVNKRRGKENKVQSSRGKKPKEKGSIILVGAQMPVGESDGHSSEETKPDSPEQSTVVPLEHTSSPENSIQAQSHHHSPVVANFEESFSSVSSLPSPISNKPLVLSPYENITTEQSALDCGKTTCYPHTHTRTHTHTYTHTHTHTHSHTHTVCSKNIILLCTCELQISCWA